MKGIKVFLMVVMISFGAMAVFADVYDDVYYVEPSLEAFTSGLLTHQVQAALEDGAITEEEADLIFKTDYLVTLTNEQRKQVCIEACKWALRKNLDLAKDSTIALERRQQFVESANWIKTTPGLKKAFNYDDVDLSLYNGDSNQMKRLREGKSYVCEYWVEDCYKYGYVKVKEKELRKAAELWGYSFEEFVGKLLLDRNKIWENWVVQMGEQKTTKPVPSGAYVNFLTSSGGCHTQLSLGEFGLSSNGRFYPGDCTKMHGKTDAKWSWGFRLPHGNPISITACGYSSRGDKIWSGVGGNSQRGVFHLPNHRFSSQSKPWLGIEIKYSEERGIVVTKVFPQSPAEKLGIKEGDRIKSLLGAGVRNVETLEQGLENIAFLQLNGQLNGKRGQSGSSQIDRDGGWLIILDQEMYVEIREKKDIPPGSY